MQPRGVLDGLLPGARGGYVPAPVTRLSASLFSLLCTLAVACATEQTGPVETLESFLELMDESTTNVESLRAAYELLDDGARRALGHRAHKAQTLSGRTYEPWEMLAQGRFRLRFAPAVRGGMRAELDGDRATVMVRDEGGELRARVPLVREAEGWRISLAIPPMSDASAAPAGSVP